MQNGHIEVLPSNIVMEEYLTPAIAYYHEILDKITPYFFVDNKLVKMIGLQQLVVSKEYQIKRNDARSAKGVDYVRECVARIHSPDHLLDIMERWGAFDLCFSAPSFKDPGLGTQVRKTFCKVGTRLFDCDNCPNTTCKHNLLWSDSSMVFDIDTSEPRLEETFHALTAAMETLGLDYAVKLSSLKGLHMNVGLPADAGTTLFDRSICQYCLMKELQAQGIPVDDNSLDPVPIIRAPYSLHYRRLTPSLPVDEETFDEAREHLRSIERENLIDRIPRSLEVAGDWDLTWDVTPCTDDRFDRILGRWREQAERAILREKSTHEKSRSSAGIFLRKGREMTDEDQRNAARLLLETGKSREQVQAILKECLNNPPKAEKDHQPGRTGMVRLEAQQDIPGYIMSIPPPLVLLLIDNATLEDMRRITGAPPVPVKAQCTNTDEGMKMLFQEPKLFRRYPRKWNCRSIFIGGLYSSFKYCSAADTVVSVKTRHVWDRDMKVLTELEQVLNEGNHDFVTAHLLGLDYCKDHGLDTDGALLVFERIIKAVSSSTSNVVLITDHSGEEMVPFFASLVHGDEYA
ncbi:hypothetical protein E2N92_01105 [Methanofollis formosanus]|uniref:Uncharacterized protein n=1 Tax=Methanofollis formosanus TaxID=299308 RepID=A0A8G0ZY54_9EURY|nr:hypothetical protein [Methanofollis formosanus]QYZ78127.1 hypothetical protein E2N92_01105 [Methanofollis formosanus]